MKRLASLLLAAGLLAALLGAPASAAAQGFGLHGLALSFTGPGGSPAVQAGSHPFAQTTDLAVNTEEKGGKTVVVEETKDLTVSLPPGFAGDPTAVPYCPTALFAPGGLASECPNSAALGIARVEYSVGEEVNDESVPLYNLAPSPGTLAKLGFVIEGVPVVIQLSLNPAPPYNVIARVRGISQLVYFLSSEITVWGVPGAEAHDPHRGTCLRSDGGSHGSCPAEGELPFLVMPTSCAAPLAAGFEADSWQHPQVPFPFSETVFARGEEGEALHPTGCERLGFAPTISSQPTTRASTSPSGLDFSLDVDDPGLLNPKEGAIADSDIEKTEVTLPAGMTVNPSQAEGLVACTEADVGRESADSAPGEGCPQASKIGTIEVETPLLEGTVLHGSLYIATPYENPTGSLIALYVVIKDAGLGISIVQPLRVSPDPKTGQLISTAEDMPQLPFSHFRLHFREGARSPLVSPPACGTYQAEAELYPYSGGAPVTSTSAFQIISGPAEGPCPAAGTPPFHPGLIAGSLNAGAGQYSPFYLDLSRTDSEQEITHFSIKLPPGLVGKLAGIPFCPDAEIAAAKARERTPHGGQEELERPSCPTASEVGHTLVGAGVGPSLTYVPGKVYLAGPYHGAPISIVAITAAKAGPFDLGTVVVREALKVNPETAEVFIDATGSDPIPHIVDGIPVHLRDIQVFTDRPEFTLNPTSCKQTSTASTVLGSGLDFASEADDQPVTVTTPFQAVNCAKLGFKPKLALSLKGGTKRGATPAFKAVLTYPKNALGNYANVAQAQVTLPHSEFLEQAHIKTICTRVQFAAGGGNGEQCPAASIYGKAKATTPLLDEPLSGPVYLRSSSHNLPDLVAALHSGEINIDLDGHIDSVKGGRIRNTFEAVPDAPVTKFTLEMRGGKKGLLVNSTNLCRSTNRAIADFTGQNGKIYDTKPVLSAKCGGKGKKKGKHGAGAHRR